MGLLLGGALSGCTPQAATCSPDDADSWGLPADTTPSFTQADAGELDRASLDRFAARADVICTAAVTDDRGQGDQAAQVVYLSSPLEELLDELEAETDAADLSPQGQATEQHARWSSADGDRGVSAYANEDGSTLITSYGF